MSFGIQADSGQLLKPRADQHDAMLLVELFKLWHSPDMMADRAWFMSEFKTKTWATLKKNLPPGSEGDTRLRRVLDFWEMVGAFVHHDVLNESLLFDIMREALQVWARVEPWVGGARKELGANQWTFIEDLARRAAEYVEGDPGNNS